mgnify:CR=1 FL=1
MQPDDSGNTITIGKQLVMQAASPEFMLHQLIGSYGFHGDTIDGIIESMNSQDGGIGKIWKSNEYILCIDREKLLITPQKEMDNLQKEKAFRLPEEGITVLPETRESESAATLAQPTLRQARKAIASPWMPIR